MAQVVLFSDIMVGKSEVPLGRYIAPYLLASKIRSHNITCQVIDYFTKIDSLDEILKKYITHDTVFVGLSSTFLGLHFECDVTANKTMMIIKQIKDFVKSINPQLPFAIGGTKALYALQSGQMNTYFDFAIVGKFENAFFPMIQALMKGEPLPFLFHKEQPFLYKDFFKSEDTDVFTPVDWFNNTGLVPQESLSIEIAKGCLYNCKFCNFDKQREEKKEITQFKNELIKNYELNGTTVYNFTDDCFNDRRQKVEEYCNAILSLPFKIEWVSYTRVDVACKFPETVDLMVQSGARGLFWGLESFNFEVARAAGKGTPTEKIKEMLLNLKKTYGNQVISLGSFIIGLPGESEQSIEDTMNWIITNQALDITWLSPLSIKPYSEKLDKYIFDYADYARNPKKYGFTEVNVNKNEWAHPHMNSAQSIKLAERLQKKLIENGAASSCIITVFQYPHLRTLGLTHEQIVDLIKNESKVKDYQKLIRSRQAEFLGNYQDMLLKQNSLTGFSLPVSATALS